MIDTNDLSVRAKNMLWFAEFTDEKGDVRPDRIEELKELIRSRAILKWRNIGMKTFKHMCQVLEVTPDERIDPHSLTHNERRAIIAIRRKDRKALLKIVATI